MKFNLIAIKIVEEAIEKEEMIGITSDGKIVKHTDSRAEIFVKTYKNDKVSDVCQRMGSRNRPYQPRETKPVVKHHHNYYNKNYYNAVDDSVVCRGARIGQAPNRYT